MSKPGMAFDCPKKGHEPFDVGGVGTEIYFFDRYPHAGAVCKKCKAPFFIQLSDEQVEISPILNEEGKQVISH